MESSVRAAEEGDDGEEELSSQLDEDASIHGDAGDGDGEAGGTATASASSVSPGTPPSAAAGPTKKKRIWFGGKVTTHVQEFDRKKPACHVSRFLVFRSRSSGSIPSCREEEDSEAPLTPTRWESGTGTSSSQRLRDPRAAPDSLQQPGRGVRGTLMPFLPLRRRSSEETSSDDGSKGGKSGSGRMREAVAYIEDPSAALRRESLDARRGKAAAAATADDPDLSPKMPRRRGMVVTVDSPNVLKFTTPINVSRDSPRQPVRRSSTKDEGDGGDGGERHDSAKVADASAVKEIKFLDLDDSTSSNVDEDDMQALERTVQTMAGPNPPGSVVEVPASASRSPLRWPSRRWSLSALPGVALTASSGSSHSSSSSSPPPSPLQQPTPCPPTASGGSGMRRWSLHAPGADGAGSLGPSKASSKSREGKRRWTWNASKIPAAS